MWLKFAIQKLANQPLITGLEGGIWVSPKLQTFQATPTHYRWVESNIDLMLNKLLPWEPAEQTDPNDVETSIPFQVYDRMMLTGWIQVRFNKLGICVNANTPSSSDRTIREFIQDLAMTIPSSKWDSTYVLIGYENHGNKIKNIPISDFL